MDEFYRNKASVEVQSRYDESLRQILPKTNISLSSAYILKTRFEDRIISNPVESTIKTQKDLELLRALITEVEEKNNITPKFIQNVYYYLGLCSTWGQLIELTYKDAYPYSIVEEPSLKKIDSLGIYANMEKKPKQKQSFSLTQIFSDFILSENELKNRAEKENIDLENETRLLKLSPNIEDLVGIEKRLDSLLFRYAKDESILVRIYALVSPTSKNTNLLLEGLIQLQAPRSLMNLQNNWE